MSGYPAQGQSQHPSQMTQQQPQEQQYPPPAGGSQPTVDPKAALKGTGILKIVTVGVGFFAMLFCAIGMNDNDLCVSEYSINSEKKEGRDPCKINPCPAFWAYKMCVAFVILAWIFSIAMLVVAILPALSQNPMVQKVDLFGHIGAAVLGILAFILGIWFVVSLLLYYSCFEANASDNCIQGVLLEAEVKGSGGSRSGSVGRSASERRGPSSGVPSDFTCKLDFMAKKRHGFNGILWIIGGLCALVCGIMCIVIFLQLKKGPRPGMGMNAVHPSQGPGSQYPSQMTQQPAPSSHSGHA